MTTLEEINEKVDRVLEALLNQKQPGVSVAEFCRRTKIGQSTAFRMLADGRLTKEKGRIPYSQLVRYLS